MQQPDISDGTTGWELQGDRACARGHGRGTGTEETAAAMTLLQSAERYAGVRGTGCVGECVQLEGPDRS